MAGIKQNLVPCLLLSGLLMFFTLVVFMYANISPDIASTVDLSKTTYRLCHSGIDLSAASYSCINQEELDKSLDLVKSTIIELQKRIEYNRCTDSTAPYTLSAKEIIQRTIEQNPRQQVMTAIHELHNMEYLINQNPQWRVNHCDISGNLLNFDKVTNLRSIQGNHFAILNPRLPFTCTLYNKMQTFFLIVGTIGLVFIVTYGIHYIVTLIIGLRRARKEAVNNLITDIINALMEKSIAEPGATIVITHLRDKLIAPAQRSKMEWAWDVAIEFLETNESRIQFEVGIRNGEDCRLMKWIDTIAGSTLPHLGARNSVKKWQISAFDKTNKIKDPPTPCLKIRHMFDQHEANNASLKQTIMDSILEKCGSECKIYDIQLDKESCCVYVRCASTSDAGIVHDQINGWWFDSRLVSIKFLRIERYLSRFPKALSGPAYLRPSNTKKLSLSNCNESGQQRPNNGTPNDDDDDDPYDEN